MKWKRRPSARPSHTGGRDTYTSGEFTLRWVGATHGVWTVERLGQQVHVTALLKDAKAAAEAYASR